MVEVAVDEPSGLGRLEAVDVDIGELVLVSVKPALVEDSEEVVLSL